MCVCGVHVLMCVEACMYMQVSLGVSMNECGGSKLMSLSSSDALHFTEAGSVCL